VQAFDGSVEGVDLWALFPCLWYSNIHVNICHSFFRCSALSHTFCLFMLYLKKYQIKEFRTENWLRSNALENMLKETVVA
jgi:hypothetical protein